METILAVDIGATNIRTAIADSNGNIRETFSEKTDSKRVVEQEVDKVHGTGSTTEHVPCHLLNYCITEVFD